MLRDGVELFKNDTGGYPNVMTDLSVTTAPTNVYNAISNALVSTTANSWKGPYVSNVDNDPISNTSFQYTNTSGKFQASSSDPEPASDGSNYQNW